MENKLNDFWSQCALLKERHKQKYRREQPILSAILVFRDLKTRLSCPYKNEKSGHLQILQAITYFLKYHSVYLCGRSRTDMVILSTIIICIV